MAFYITCECDYYITLRVCSVQERSGMECNSSILVFSWAKKMEWNGSVRCLVETNIWNGMAKFYDSDSQFMLIISYIQHHILPKFTVYIAILQEKKDFQSKINFLLIFLPLTRCSLLPCSWRQCFPINNRPIPVTMDRSPSLWTDSRRSGPIPVALDRSLPAASPALLLAAAGRRPPAGRRRPPAAPIGPCATRDGWIKEGMREWDVGHGNRLGVGGFIVFGQRAIRMGGTSTLHQFGGTTRFRIWAKYSVSRNSSIPLFCLTEHQDGCQVRNGSITFHLMTPTEHTLRAITTKKRSQNKGQRI
jgi:hypothetical protein